jgi:hypothetical protein
MSLCQTGWAHSYDRLELTPVSAVSQFENSVRYRITYWKNIGDGTLQVFPTRAEKKADLDLILAQVIRTYTEQEYEARGRYLDETNLKDSTTQEILHLVSKDHETPAWGKGNIEALKHYFRFNSSHLKLYLLEAYTDYRDDRGGFVSGIDYDPVLFKFGATPDQADEVSLIMVITTDQ